MACEAILLKLQIHRSHFSMWIAKFFGLLNAVSKIIVSTKTWARWAGPQASAINKGDAPGRPSWAYAVGLFLRLCCASRPSLEMGPTLQGGGLSAQFPFRDIALRSVDRPPLHIFLSLRSLLWPIRSLEGRGRGARRGWSCRQTKEPEFHRLE